MRGIGHIGGRLVMAEQAVLVSRPSACGKQRECGIAQRAAAGARRIGRETVVIAVGLVNVLEDVSEGLADELQELPARAENDLRIDIPGELAGNVELSR